MRALIGVELLRKLPIEKGDIRDTKLPGFVLRVRPSGVHTYFASYTPRRPKEDQVPDGAPARKRVAARWHVIGTTKVLSAPEAREEARQVLAEAMKGRDPIAEQRAEQRAAMTVETFLTDHYEPWATTAQKHGDEQIRRLRVVFAELLPLRLDEVSPFQVERWRTARLKAGTAPATVNRDLNTLRGAFSRAVEWKKATAHPLAEVKACKTDRRPKVRYLEAGEQTRLLAALDARDEKRRAERLRANDWRRERGYRPWPEFGTYTDHLSPLVRLALHTGLRRGELFALRWTDVDIVGAVLTVRGDTAKSGQTRHLPLNTTAVSVLTSWRGSAETSALVFPGAEGAPLEDIKKGWGAIVKAAKLKHFRFHDCRHDFASKLVMAGVDLNTVRELLGHASLDMVLRYAHLAPEHRAAAVAKLVTA